MDESLRNQERSKPPINTSTESNEQVIFICPGCNSSEEKASDNGCYCCNEFCRKVTRRTRIFVLSGPGLTILLLSYLMIGAVTFNILEGGRKFDYHNFNTSKKNNPNRDVQIRTAVERLWKITENLNVLYKDNWTKLAGEEINNLQNYFYDELTKRKDSATAINECNTKNYLSNREENPPFQNLGECFLFSLSLLTTVGSGNILPHSIWGRVVSIFYIMIGFFIMLIYLAGIGDYFGNLLRQIHSYITGGSISAESHSKSIFKCTGSTCEKSRRQYGRTSLVPIWLVAITLVIYITGGAFIFNSLEEWNLLDSWYFCFLSLVTIGFGGFTPGRMENISMIATSAYILIGMTLMSVCFNLIQTDVIVFLRNLSIWSNRETALEILLPNRTPSS